VRDVAHEFLTADTGSEQNRRSLFLTITKSAVKRSLFRQNLGKILLTTASSKKSILTTGLSQENGSFWDRLLQYIMDFVQKIRERGSVSEEDARRIFDDMADETDIPYNFPDDGCYARAHEMVKRISDRHKIDINDIDKVFIYGNLEADTNYIYDPIITFQDGSTMRTSTDDGTVNWGWHVAPIIKVRQGDKIVDMVIDPSLADGPITVDE